MNSSDIDLFKTLYEEKNITHTAKRLFISQPALSHRLRNLEKEFDCTLVLRQPRGITFTPEGERLYRLLPPAGKGLPGHPGGAFLLPVPAGRLHIHRLLQRIQQIPYAQAAEPVQGVYPQVEIHLRSGFSQHLYRDFREGKFQLCIVRGDRNWEEEKTLFVAGPHLCLQQGTPGPDKAAQFPLHPLHHGPAMQDLLDDWWYAHFSQPPMTTIETDAMDTSLKMVQQGLGFTFLTQSCGQDTPGLQAQILTDSKGNPLIRETWLYYRKDYTKLSGLKAFIDFITQAYPLAEDK